MDYYYFYYYQFIKYPECPTFQERQVTRWNGCVVGVRPDHLNTRVKKRLFCLRVPVSVFEQTQMTPVSPPRLTHESDVWGPEGRTERVVHLKCSSGLVNNKGVKRTSKPSYSRSTLGTASGVDYRTYSWKGNCWFTICKTEGSWDPRTKFGIFSFLRFRVIWMCVHYLQNCCHCIPVYDSYKVSKSISKQWDISIKLLTIRDLQTVDPFLHIYCMKDEIPSD